MNRRYNTAEYKAGCDILRKYFEHPAITTDVIVGFPGETEEEFVYFNSVGLSYLDVNLANWMYKKTVAAHKGITISMKEKSMFEYGTAF